jgi:hypothetical protein
MLSKNQIVEKEKSAKAVQTNDDAVVMKVRIWKHLKIQNRNFLIFTFYHFRPNTAGSKRSSIS